MVKLRSVLVLGVMTANFLQSSDTLSKVLFNLL